MRCTIFYRVTTACIRYGVGYFDPVYTTTRTRDIVKTFVFRFVRRSRLTYHRITHHGKVTRGETNIVANRFAAATVHVIESEELLPSESDVVRYSFVYNTDQMSDVRFLCASATGKRIRLLILFADVHGADVHDDLCAERSLFGWDKAYFTVQPKAYCDQRVMQEWIDKLKGAHAKVVYVPPGTTGISQPMDVAVMKTTRI
ncbi:Hypothetical protein PHPALM_1037 [Phytophthora palmivora]|uniref:Uncharacterized protein n=1 Tax=Phytophthora palmivora TaxID=4796 RepID=A0A2P4YTC4_9STRA|nr:Hypothetical protein PHPALM_1037 [Phytophthora palmivora]